MGAKRHKRVPVNEEKSSGKVDAGGSGKRNIETDFIKWNEKEGSYGTKKRIPYGTEKRVSYETEKRVPYGTEKGTDKVRKRGGKKGCVGTIAYMCRDNSSWVPKNEGGIRVWMPQEKAEDV